jgi:hypothetical protein
MLYCIYRVISEDVKLTAITLASLGIYSQSQSMDPSCYEAINNVRDYISTGKAHVSDLHIKIFGYIQRFKPYMLLKRNRSLATKRRKVVMVKKYMDIPFFCVRKTSGYIQSRHVL